jgi:hypothetical protein
MRQHTIGPASPASAAAVPAQSDGAEHCHVYVVVGQEAAQVDGPASEASETQHTGVAPEQYWMPESVASS